MAVNKTEKFRNLFDIEWQRRFVYILCNSRKACGIAMGELEPDYFENAADKHTARLIMSHVEDKQELPMRHILKTSAKVSNGKGEIDDDEIEIVLERIDEAFKAEISRAEIDTAIEHFVGFAKLQAIKHAIIESASKLSADEYEDLEDEINGMFRDISMIGQDAGDLGLDLYTLPKLIRERGDDFIKTISPLYMRQISKACGDGFALGGLYTIMAPMGGGKTTMLINLGGNFVEAGYSVAHITLEMASEKIAARYAARLMPEGTDWKDVAKGESIDILEKRIEEYREFAEEGKLFVKDYPAKTLNISKLRGYIMMAKIRGEKPDVLIVDYPDEMALPGREKTYAEVGNLFRQLRGIAQEEQMVVIAATQANREGLSKKRPKLEHVASAIDKASVSDAIMAVAMTDEEKTLGFARLYFIKSRDDQLTRPIWLKADFKRARLEEISFSEERMMVPGNIYTPGSGGINLNSTTSVKPKEEHTEMEREESMQKLLDRVRGNNG